MLRTERIVQEDGSVVTRFFYDSGAIGEAHVYKAEERGVSRHWHPNGVLASEKTIQGGIIEGVASYWNDRGELVDSFEIRNGSGVWRIWELDEQSRWYRYIECRTINNMKIGRQLVYSDHGTTAIEAYWINDKKISKKRYFKACDHDPNLPRYDWEPPVPPPPPKEPRPPAKVSDDLPLELLKGPAVREALAWLEESCEPSRSLGEGTTQASSLRLVKKLYSLGAVNVHAVEIDGEPQDDQNAGKLVVELPQEAASRKRLLQYSGRLARKLGFEPDHDTGQRYVFLMLD